MEIVLLSVPCPSDQFWGWNWGKIVMVLNHIAYDGINTINEVFIINVYIFSFLSISYLITVFQSWPLLSNRFLMSLYKFHPPTLLWSSPFTSFSCYLVKRSFLSSLPLFLCVNYHSISFSFFFTVCNVFSFDCILYTLSHPRHLQELI
jgi:hypothetical protein